MKLIFLCLFSIPAVLSRDFNYDDESGDSETLPAENSTNPRGHRPYDTHSKPTETIGHVSNRNEPNTRRYRFQAPTTPQAQKSSQRTFDNDKGGCLFIGNDMGVLCPNGCELRTALIKDEQNMMPVIKNLKLQVSNLSQSSNAINIYVERVANEMHRRESRYLGNNHILSSYSTELEERFSLIKEKVTQTLPSSIRVMRSLVDSFKEKLENLEHAVTKQKEYCAHPCVVSCNIPVVSGKECNDIYEKGGRTSQLYLIQPDSFNPYKVYCDMITEEGGWTLIQNRQDGSVDFGRSWDAYKYGFGNIAYDSGKGFCDTPGEYWLGNDRISQLTKMKTTELLFEMRDWNDDSVTAHYSKFVVQSEVNKYRLSVNGYSGVAGNTLIEGAKSLFGINRTMTIHQDMMFSTYNRDNDGWEPENPTKQCAREDGGGWWYNRCHSANPNGRYYIGGEYTKEMAKHGTDDGIVWMDWKGSWYSLKKMNMKIRPQFTSAMPDQEQIPMEFLTP